ncbi:MAG: alpha-ribazole phosphatase [Methylococcales bacterium]|nr:alpha-ribazole phosphatase [Methylococcales bacterium]
MDIYLIRHTQTANVEGLCYGQSDLGLAISFPEEVEVLHDKLPSFDQDCRVFSSTLTRCVQLAETFSKSVIKDPRLQELNFGDWEGQRFDDIDPVALQDWTDNFATAKPPNGESFADLYQRAGEFWQELLATPSDQVIIVTHAGIIRALLARVLNLPPANAFQFRIDPGSVHKLQRVDDYIYLEYVNL